MAVPPPSPATDAPRLKALLRRDLRIARRSFAAAATDAMRAALARNVADAGGGASPVGAYDAVRGEPEVLTALSGSGQAIALPRSEADGSMRFVAWRPGTPLRPGRFAIGEPPAGPAVVPALLFVPLLGFDRARRRLGQGGGHYDRWLAAHPHVVAIGVGWSVQEVPTLPHEPWDRSLHAIVTECEVVRS